MWKKPETEKEKMNEEKKDKYLRSVFGIGIPAKEIKHNVIVNDNTSVSYIYEIELYGNDYKLHFPAMKEKLLELLKQAMKENFTELVALGNLKVTIIPKILNVK